MALADIETIVFLMMENRSFDHVLGYLSLGLDEPPMPLEGLRDDGNWMSALANPYAGQLYHLHALTPAEQILSDPPHDSKSIALQIDTRAAGGGGMGGFVASYMNATPRPANPSDVMGYYRADAVPMFDFLARNFAVCDHWFASLPAGTQPNRLMAMGGESSIIDNAPFLLPDQDLVYDWLNRHQVDWCAYQYGDFLPFFALMPKWLPRITSSLAFEPQGRFRRYSRFHDHWMSQNILPRVIFIEPEYTDGPHIAPNDDHPPTSIARGQAFLADVYKTLRGNPGRWRDTLLIITYDEHGGLFDHVPPLAIPAKTGGTAVNTTGIRVPAFLVSPHVARGVPFTGTVDHTSFLQLLADRFDGGKPYSAAVAERQRHLVPLSSALTAPAAITEPPPDVVAQVPVGGVPAVHPQRNTNDTGDAFHQAAMKLAREHPATLATPAWSDLARYVAAPATMPKHS